MRRAEEDPTSSALLPARELLCAPETPRVALMRLPTQSFSFSLASRLLSLDVIHIRSWERTVASSASLLILQPEEFHPSYSPPLPCLTGTALILRMPVRRTLPVRGPPEIEHVEHLTDVALVRRQRRPFRTKCPETSLLSSRPAHPLTKPC